MEWLMSQQSPKHETGFLCWMRGPALIPVAVQTGVKITPLPPLLPSAKSLHKEK